MAKCLLENSRNYPNRPLFEGCGSNYVVYGDSGATWKINDRGDRDCFYPSLHGLDNIAEHYPNSTVLLVHRNVDAWIKSTHSWMPSILNRMSKACTGNGTGVPPAFSHDAWETFYNQHTESIRTFCKLHHLTYIEVSLEDPDIGVLLESKIGISRKCWGHYNKMKPERSRVVDTTK
jgi:hypothetical protein